VGVDQAIALKPGETLQREFDVASPPTALAPGINRMQIVAAVSSARKPETFDENFFAPVPPTASPGGKD
jgi:hypothetical protein